MNEQREIFVCAARDLISSRSTRSRIKESEITISQLRKADPEHGLVLCCSIIQSFCPSDPVCLVAAQSVLWIFQHRKINNNMSDLLLQTVKLCIMKSASYNSAVVLQLSSANAASIFDFYFPEYIKNNNVQQGWLTCGLNTMLSSNVDVNSELWTNFVLTVASALPEMACLKESACHWNSTFALLGANGRQSELKRMSAMSLVFAETSGVIALTDSTLSSNTNTVTLNCTLCGIAWLESAQDVLQDACCYGEGSEQVSAAASAAFSSVLAWHHSQLLFNVLHNLVQEIDLNCELSIKLQVSRLDFLAAFCKVTAVDTSGGSGALLDKAKRRGKFSAGSSGKGDDLTRQMNTALCDLAGKLSVQLLPALLALFKASTQRLCTGADSVPPEHLHALLSESQRSWRCLCECIRDLAPRSTALLSSSVSSELAACWVSLLPEALQALEEHLSCAAKLFQQEHSVLIVESLLPVISILAEHVMKNNSESIGMGAIVERAAVAAIRACAYMELHRQEGGGLQSAEDFEEFRNMVREWLREVSATVPGMHLWLLHHATNALKSYAAAQIPAAAHGIGWSEAETLLHAVSALTKPILSSMREGQTTNCNQMQMATLDLVTVLIAEDVCTACRPLSRMAVVILAEFLPSFKSPEHIALRDTALYRLLCSLQHPEVAFEISRLPEGLRGVMAGSDVRMFSEKPGLDRLACQGKWLAFRVKQDHIGAVSFLKALSSIRAEALLESHTSQWLPALVKRLQSEDSSAVVLAEAVRSVGQHGNCMMLPALFTFLYVELVRCQHLSGKARVVSATSAGLVNQAVQRLLAQCEVPLIGLLTVPVTLAACACMSGQHNVEFAEQFARLYTCTAEMDTLMALTTLLSAHCPLQKLLEVLAGQLKQVQTTDTAVVLWESTHSLLCSLTSCAKFSPILLTTVHDLLTSTFEIGSKVAQSPTTHETGRVLVCLQSLYEVYIVIVKQQRVMELLKPAESLLRSLGQHSTHAAAASLFHRSVQEVSQEGVGVLLESSSSAEMTSLLAFWATALSATELHPSSVGENYKKFPLSAIGFPTLYAVLSAVCDRCDQALLVIPSSTGAAIDTHHPAPAVFSEWDLDTWRTVFRVLAYALGPIRPPTADSGRVLNEDGTLCQPLLASLVLQEESFGEVTLIRWLEESGCAARIVLVLLGCLVRSSPSPACSTSAALPIACPPEAREQAIAVLTKLVVCLGSRSALASLAVALSTYGCPLNGTISREDSRAAWSSRLIAHASSGDWKQFKSTAKTLCRG